MDGYDGELWTLFKSNQAIIYEIDDGKAQQSTIYNSPTANEETMNVFMIQRWLESWAAAVLWALFKYLLWSGFVASWIVADFFTVYKNSTSKMYIL